MKIAVISDIHSNYCAFKAVLDDLKYQEIDMTIFLGDYIFNGYGSNEVIDMLVKYKNENVQCHIIAGNIDELIQPIEEGAEWIYPINKQIYEELGEARIDFIKELPKSLSLNILNQRIKVCHNPSKIDIFEVIDDINREKNVLKEDSLFAMAQDMDEDICLFGHYHLFIDEVVGSVRFISPSAAGMPFNGDPRAQYIILDISEEDVQVIQCFVAYNMIDLIKIYENNGYYRDHYIRSINTIMTYMTGHNYMNQ